LHALITGIGGQDGSYLAELLLSKGYEVHGTIRRSSLPNTQRLDKIKDQLHLHYADLTDATSLLRVIQESQPDEIYNLAACSDVGASFDVPEYSGDATGLGCTRMLELVRLIKPDAKFYQAGSSEMFGMNPRVPCDEDSSFMPGSPYAAAKVYAHQMTTVYRESYGLWAVNGIGFNHESERRGAEFVSRKITLGIADIVHGRADKLVLGNLDAKRDWHHAADTVMGMWLAMQAPEPSDYVFASGAAHSVRDFLQTAFDRVGLDWTEYVTSDSRYMRPMDPPLLLGNPRKAERLLNWEQTMVFTQLVHRMVDADVAMLRA
jgi:GDPmannose 4,6-dehydratase